MQPTWCLHLHCWRDWQAAEKDHKAIRLPPDLRGQRAIPATVRLVAFAALDALRALPRLAEFPLRSFARFCTFDAFLRLAMIEPLWLLP